MAVRLQLDTLHAHYTNLDFITGRAILILNTDTPISSIVVKLEGESRSRLSAAKYPHNERSEKKRSEVEVHKLLYKTTTVFPAPEVLEHAAPNTYYTLSPGTYEYPFRFKFPFNNDCINNNLATNLNMAGLRLEVARDNNRHVRKSLPPSISGLPGEAEIKYFVKVTVARPQFYKENYRAFADFKFLPIEPPRSKDPEKETYARRQHQFTQMKKIPEKKSIFRAVDSHKTHNTDELPPRFSIDARLPSPPIITCNEPLPLRILVQKLGGSSEAIYLQLIQIELIGYTHIRAHDLARSESGSWVILSKSNMGIPLGDENQPHGKEWKIDPSLWNTLPLPSSVAPSFDTCNLSRSYELEVRVGLTHGSSGSMKPELIVLPLRMAVQVYSGIAPPQALLDAIGTTEEQHEKVQTPHVAPPQPPRPPNPQYMVPHQPDDYDDAPPPSYEDAMAETLAPVDGPRREYNPLDASQNVSQTGADIKTSVGNNKDNKDNDRLFPNTETSGEPNYHFDEYPTKLAGRSAASSSPSIETKPEALSDNHTQHVLQTPDQEQPPPPQPQRRITPRMGVPARKPVPGSDKKTG